MPYFQNALGMANNVANQPYQGYGGPRVADFSDDQYKAFDMVRGQAEAGNPVMGQGLDYISNVLGQDQSNPYLQQMIDDSSQDVTTHYNRAIAPNLMSQFQQGGAFGGTAHQQMLQGSQGELANQLGRVSTQMRSQDYDRQNALKMGALGMLPQLNDARYDDSRALLNIGQQQQNLAQNVFDTGYDDFVEQRDWQANRLGVLTNALGSIQGGTSSQTGANPNYRSAGQNAAAAAMVLASMWGS